MIFLVGLTTILLSDLIQALVLGVSCSTGSQIQANAKADLVQVIDGRRCPITPLQDGSFRYFWTTHTFKVLDN